MKYSIKITISLLMFTLCCFCIPFVASGYKLPDTGIEKCYDNYGNMIECQPATEDVAGRDFYRQDAHYNNPKMSYSVNSDGTILDKNTNLTWQNRWLDNNGNQINFIKSKWQSACDYCDSLELGGYSDWRLPTKHELFSVVDLSKSNPAINTSFANTKNTYYWSETSNSYNTNNAWYVNFSDGYVGEQSKNNGLYVRCVRSDELLPSYRDNGDGTITDLNTDLTWQKQDDGKLRNWQEALEYSENLTISNYSDWRLPNIRELETIVDDSKHLPAIYDYFNVSSSNIGYWSSSTYTLDPKAAWAVYAGAGNVYARNKIKAYNAVRCVRVGQYVPLKDLVITPNTSAIYVNIEASFSATLTGGLSPYTYTFEWDFDNDGVFEKSGSNPTHTYTSVGSNVVTCRVTDESGENIQKKLSVDVISASMKMQIHQIDTSSYNTIQSMVSVRDDNGDVITGLTDSNFKLYEDDNPISSFTLDLDETAVSLSLVLDYSGSMSEESINDLESAAYDFVTHMEPTDEAEIIKFDSEISVVQSFTTDQALLKKAIYSDFGGGMTALYDAIYKGVTDTVVRPANNKQVVIAMTDGASNSDQYTQQEVIDYAKQNNIPVYTIGLGSGVEETNLKNIAEGTGGLYYSAPDSAKLKEIYQEIASTVLHPYIIKYQTTVADAQEHVFRVDLDYAGTTISKAATYAVPCSFGFCSSIKIKDITSCLNLVTVDLEFTTNTNEVSSISFDINYDSSKLNNDDSNITSLLDAPFASLGPVGVAANKEISFNKLEGKDTLRVGIYSDEDAYYDEPIASGTGVIASITFEVAPTVSIGDTTKLSIEIQDASDPYGKAVTVNADTSGGNITFGGNCCLGDCNADGTVSDEELENAYNQFLGIEPGTNPPQGCNDKNGDGVVSISDLQTVVMNYLKGCSN